MRLTIAAIALSLAGCAAKVVSSTPTNVIVDHPGNRPGFSKALAAAQEQCQQHGRSAVMDRQTCHGAPGPCTTQFRCE
ncbi:MAG: hypothetical protein AB1430_02710 [Pseudomonadota bacterium]